MCSVRLSFSNWDKMGLNRFDLTDDLYSNAQPMQYLLKEIGNILLALIS